MTLDGNRHPASLPAVCGLHTSVHGPEPDDATSGTTLASKTFPAEVTSVGKVRRFVRETLGAPGCHGEDREELVPDVLLAVSELAANAVVHGRSDFDVTVASSAGRLRIGVGDAEGARPVRRRPTSRQTAGRGLVLVDSVADRWGVETCQTGKTVWAEFDSAPRDTSGRRHAADHRRSTDNRRG